MAGNHGALITSGSLSHRIHDNQDVLNRPYEISDEFNRQCDLRTLELWQAGRWAEFTAMLPSYAKACTDEGWMHDTATLLGALGWGNYKAHANLVTPYLWPQGPDRLSRSCPWSPCPPNLIDLPLLKPLLEKLGKRFRRRRGGAHRGPINADLPNRFRVFDSPHD